MRIYLASLGCKLNQNEIETLTRRFLAAGHEIALQPQEADICVLNTCTVTHVAARKTRQALRRLRRESPDSVLVATGCHAEIAPEEIASLGVDLIVGNADKEQIPALLAAQIPNFEGAGALEADLALRTLGPLSNVAQHTRAFIKIQDGCDNACTYCIVSTARGPARSRPQPEVLAEIRQRVAEGYQEIVLTGVHIGSYGRERGANLTGLVTAILAETEVPRLRLSSIEPWDVEPALLTFWPNPRLCRHLHLPLQSGDDATLARMGRRYTTAQFAQLLTAARAAVPEMAFTTDVIVGFPGESEAEFEASLEFVRAQALARIHVFPYSLRPNTPAATMPNQVRPEVKEVRSQAMRQVAREAARRFEERFLGATLPVLWENRVQEAGPAGHPLWKGLTDNYLPVLVESERPLGNCILPARLVALRREGLWAKLEE